MKYILRYIKSCQPSEQVVFVVFKNMKKTWSRVRVVLVSVEAKIITVGAFKKKFGDIRALRKVRYPFVNTLRAVSRAFVNTRSDRLEHAPNARCRDCERLDLRGNDIVYLRHNGGCRTTF